MRVEKPNKMHNIDLGFLHISVYWIQCPRKDLAEIISKRFPHTESHNLPNPSSCTNGLFLRIRERLDFEGGAIWLEPGANIDTVAHECFHAAEWVLASRGNSMRTKLRIELIKIKYVNVQFVSAVLWLLWIGTKLGA